MKINGGAANVTLNPIKAFARRCKPFGAMTV
jgi:hypothetical protein